MYFHTNIRHAYLFYWSEILQLSIQKMRPRIFEAFQFSCINHQHRILVNLFIQWQAKEDRDSQTRWIQVESRGDKQGQVRK